MTLRRGATVLALAVLALSSGLSYASAEDNVIINGRRWRWPYGAVYNVASYTLPAGFQPAIDNAANKWNGIPTPKMGITRGADVNPVDPNDSYRNTVWFGEIPIAWQGPECSVSGTIACTRISAVAYCGPAPCVGQVDNMKTVWNSSNSYTNTCPWWWPSNPDIESVFLHEFGHWGLLGHTSDGSAVMQTPYYTCNQNLTQHDANSMHTLYGP
jgi:hypothetical protein